jgi:serine/threonine-protein kinase
MIAPSNPAKNMPADPSVDSRIAKLAEAVADGDGVDWKGVEIDAADTNERAAIRSLQLLDEIGKVHRLRGNQEARSESLSQRAPDVSTTAPAPSPSPDHEFWGPLRIRKQIGTGGFGTVYQAIDPRLDREVALKLLRSDGSLPSDRSSTVIDEGRLLARIRHPNVVTVFGADAFNGRVGIWMELVKGRTLGDIVRDQGAFSAYEASIIGLTLCSAVAAVHRSGLLHRDIKAQNVMREDGGRIVLMDFSAGEQQPVAGALRSPVKGTPLYLAPEVLEGGQASVASDLYALGVLLFFLVTGDYPVKAGDFQALREAHRSQRRTRLRDLRQELPDGFVSTVECALHPDRKRRFSSAGAMQFALTEVLGVRFAAESIGGAVQSSERPGPAAEGAPSIAVLPFIDMSPAKDQAYLCEGLAEELINALSALPDVHVAARSSAFQFSGPAQDIRRVGEQLNVQTVLEGSVRKAGNRLRITTQLIEVRGGYHLWSERYDRELDDVFAVQDEIARAIVSKLKVRLHAESYGPLVKRHTEDLEAYNLYLQGRYYWSRRYAGGIERAIQFFTQTITRDNSHALAHAGLAECFSLLGIYDLLPPAAAIPKARAAAARALELDDSASETHEAMALVRWYCDWDYAAALSEYRRALQLNPNSAVALALMGILLADLGRFDEARSAVARATSLEPVSALIAFYSAATLALSGPLEDALPECQRTLDLDPNFLPGLWSYGTILAHLGRIDEAIDAVERTLTLSHRQSFFLGGAGHVYALLGRGRDVERILDELRQLAGRGYVSPLSFAQIAAASNDLDEAFRWLDRAATERTPFLVAVGVAPFYDAVRSDPRFPGLLAKVGLDTVLPPLRRRL